MTYSTWKNRKIYTVYGVIFGFIFPLIAFSIEVLRLKIGFSFQSWQLVHDQIPVHYIIDTAPFFLGLFAFVAGYNLDKAVATNDKLKKTSKYKEVFFTNMSHEIRTPMQGIIGMIDLLSNDKQLNKEQRKYVNTIQQSSKDLLAILNDILDLSKIEAEQMRIQNKPMNLEFTMQKIHRLFLPITKQKNIEIVLQYDTSLPESIIADPLRITQVVSNLVGNAVKFTNEGKIEINVTKISDTPELRIKIEIKDEGSGIEEKDLKCIFDSFKQVKNTAEAESTGTGLGLTICQKLATLMGGKIEAKSQLGKGSSFSFTFVAKENTIQKELRKTEAITNNFDKRILLVDDSKINQKVIGLLLEQMGCQIVIASDGVEACVKAKEQWYDMILMDINMPRLNGLEAAKKIRETSTNKPIIIGLSANVLSDSYDEQQMKTFFDDYLTKPLTIQMLSKKLNKWFMDC